MKVLTDMEEVWLGGAEWWIGKPEGTVPAVEWCMCAPRRLPPGAALKSGIYFLCNASPAPH